MLAPPPLPAGASLKLTLESVPRAWALDVEVTWGTAGYLPFRLRLFAPSGAMVEELFRATTPDGSTPLAYERASDGAPSGAPHAPPSAGPHATTFRHRIALGANATPGTWTVEAHEWLAGSTVTARGVRCRSDDGRGARRSATPCRSTSTTRGRSRSSSPDTRAEPPFDKMNPDCRRVFQLGAARTTFAVFGPESAAAPIAAALRSKGMTVAVNPAYEVVPFEREPGHGGTGPLVDHGTANFENVYAHAVVLPGHPLGHASWERGHINRPTTPTFPGPGRAYVQWGSGGYQAGFENVWVFGDAAAGTAWLLAAIEGKPLGRSSSIVTAQLRAAAPKPVRFARRLVVTQEIKLWDTPTGIGASPDGSIVYALLAGGFVAAYDRAGRRLWETHALLQGGCLAVSPRGDRVAVGGFPGLLVLDAASGKVLGGYRVTPLGPAQSFGSSRMVAAAWNDEGTRVAAGAIREGSLPANGANAASGVGQSAPTFALALLDANGNVDKLLSEAAPRPFTGDVTGVAFVPHTGTLLVGAAPQLTAIDTKTGHVLWRTDIGGAQSFRVTPDGKTAAAGGWGKRAGSFGLADGKTLAAATFRFERRRRRAPCRMETSRSRSGAGTHPLYRLRAGQPSPEALAQARFAFHDVLWWEEESALLAAEQGGPLWLLDPNANAKRKEHAKLDDAGTTAHRIVKSGRELIVGRMNRVVQRVVAR